MLPESMFDFTWGLFPEILEIVFRCHFILRLESEDNVSTSINTLSCVSPYSPLVSFLPPKKSVSALPNRPPGPEVYPVHCGGLSTVLALHPLDATAPSPGVTTKTSPDNTDRPLGPKLSLRTAALKEEVMIDPNHFLPHENVTYRPLTLVVFPNSL